MTGFGKVSKEFDDKTISVEIKSLNSKQLDLNLRLPSFLREKEMELRTDIQRMLERGKVDVSFSVEYRQESPAASINPAVVKAYAVQINKIAEELNQSVNDMMGLILKMPDVLKNEKKELDENEWSEILEVCILAAGKLNEFRSREGKTLSLEFTKRIQIIQNLLTQVENLDAGRIGVIRDRISRNIMEVVSSDKIDANRMEQELIFYVEKMDITEEKVRLQTHLSYFLEAMKEPSCGRKLNFISQEIGREINTIGSKANDASIQKLVVQMKDELEKIKEQTMNIL
ncbi:MAG: YicC/YloC family endoribonuclease [Bacteroidota bacterium]